MGFEVRLIDETSDPGITADRQAFQDKFGSKPTFYVRVPGRVNIIGEHIDYCGYGVLPMAIEAHIRLTVGPSLTSSTKIRLVNVNEAKYAPFETNLAEGIEIDQSQPHWWNYFLCGVKGALEAIPDTQPIGFDCLVHGSIPPSSGLSSSSAVVVSATLAAFLVMGKLQEFDPASLGELCAKSERFIGTQGGGMDQAIELLAVEGKAQHIEFNPLRTESVELPKDACFVIANSLAEANKAAGSEFNQRVVECRLATKLLGKLMDVLKWKELARLKDLQQKLGQSLPDMIKSVEAHLHAEPYSKSELLALLDMTEDEMDSTVLTANTRHLQAFRLNQRALHVFSEAFRVHEYKRICLEAPSLRQLGDLMQDSHRSCTDLYQCSHPDLDRLVKMSIEAGAYGARLTGAGWGGCIVALVPAEKVSTFVDHLQQNYYDSHKRAQDVAQGTYLFPTKPGCGARVFTEEK